MNKILRLSWANIKKHKFETISLFILVVFCVTLMGSSLSASKSIDRLFPEMMKSTGSVENFFYLPQKDYDDEFLNIMKGYSEVESAEKTEFLLSQNTNYIDRNNKESALAVIMITLDGEKVLSNPKLDTSLTESEIAAMEHPIYMPYSVKDNLRYSEGDEFTIINGSRKYTFTIAGFYDSPLFNTAGQGLKMIVSDADYYVLESVMDKLIAITYNDHQGQGGTKLIEKFVADCTEYSNNDIGSAYGCITYDSIEELTTFSSKMLLNVLIILSVIVIISIAIIIVYRVSEDISKQIVNIGVLEAMGYRSSEISMSYVMEYMIISAAGAAVGIFFSLFFAPALSQLGNTISGHRVTTEPAPFPVVATAVVITCFIMLIAFLRSLKIRKYPPVTALRNGTGDHSFKKSCFPVEKTRSNVHLRLALKGFTDNIRQCLGLSICVTISTTVIVFSFILFNFFISDPQAIERNTGMELSDLRIQTMETCDTEQFASELSEFPEVRKALPTSAGFDIEISYVGTDKYFLPFTFDDFNETENIFTMSGRFPTHDNEVMVTNTAAKTANLDIGSNITLEYKNIRKNYIITGIVPSLTNGGANLYLTCDALKRLIPTYHHNTVEVYLNEGVDTDEFKHTLTARYGRSISDSVRNSSSEGSYEEKIRSEADRMIADMMGAYGVSHVEYSIQSGDTVISGNSSEFIIRSISNIGDIIKTQLESTKIAIQALTTIFVIISAALVMILLFILMESNIRNSRREFGIMKSMGYTSKELMIQLAFRIVPAALVAIITGTILSTLIVKLISYYAVRVHINMTAVVILDIVLLVFCFICAYIGARKIKNISVCELMNE